MESNKGELKIPLFDLDFKLRLELQTSTLGSQIAELGNSLALELKSRTPTDQNFVAISRGLIFCYNI